MTCVALETLGTQAPFVGAGQVLHDTDPALRHEVARDAEAIRPLRTGMDGIAS
jgi:hypothetical protein